MTDRSHDPSLQPPSLPSDGGRASLFRRIRTFVRPALLAGAALTIAGLVLHPPSLHAEDGRAVPPPLLDETPGHTAPEVAVLAGGCFWGVQGVFQHVAGVTGAVSGYAGGEQATAHYRMVGSGTTGHAETVRITYDPARISYGRLLQIYFSVAHDPTERDRQGPDSGTQYRSTIFPLDAEQARVAKAYIAQLDAAHAFEAAIATTVEPNRPFYPAEAYHQDYLTRNPTDSYIVFNDLPKIQALKRYFPGMYRPDPVLVVAGATP